MLNFKEGTPIAKIIGGEYNNKLVYISKNNDNSNSSSDSDDSSRSSDNSGLASEEEEKERGKQLIINHGRLEQRLDIYERSVSYIAGPSGAGKTTYAVNLI